MLSSLLKPAAYISVPFFLIRSMCSASPTIRYHVRVGVYLGIFVVLGACSSVIALVMAIGGNRFSVNYVVARTFYFLAGNALDLSVEVEGEEHLQDRPAVLLANHQSVLDMFIIGKVMPKHTSIMSKKSIQFTPLGPFMTMSGAIFIDRANPARAVRSLKDAGESMKVRKTSIWMYPEGTRSTTEVPSMLPLKKGAFHLAVQAGIPIIPIVTENTWKIFRKGFFGSGVLKVRVLPPISTEGLTVDDVNALSTRVREEMMKTLVEISAKISSSSPEPEPEPQSRIDQVLDATPKVILPEPSLPVAQPAEPVDVIATEPDIPPTSMPPPESRGSQESLSSDSHSHPSRDRSSTGGSEAGTGTETEEDEGMVLVGRPA